MLPAAPRRITRRMVAAGAAMLLATAAVLAGVHWLNRLPPPGERDLAPSGWSAFLFNGTNLQVWLHDSDGQWTVAKDEEQANVLAGQDGVTRRSLVRSDASGSRPLEFFKLQLAVAIHQGRAIEVQFGIPAPPESGSLLAVRFDGREAIFGRRSGARGNFKALSSPLRVTGSPEQKHSIVIERHSQGWFVFFDEHPLGAIGVLHERHEPKFLLVSEGGPSWFSDIMVEELVRDDAPSASESHSSQAGSL
jgi:hypothetical protein